MIQTVEKNHRGGISRYSSRIDFRGNVLEAKETHNEPGRTEDVLKTINTFDHRGRLLQSRVKLNNSDEMVVKETYNPLGQVVKWQFGPGAEQGLNFFPITYNIQGWVTSYGNTNFRYTLNYFDPTMAAPSYTGNVTQVYFRHAMASDQHLAYSYDKANRLTTAQMYLNGKTEAERAKEYEETDFVYDLNSNITSLKRANQPISMTYDGNKLAQYNKAGYFEYDANGNTTATRNTGKDLQFEFNSLNLLDNVKQNGAVKARYIWTADGAKRAVADAARSNGFEYLGSLVYARMNGVLELESANLPDGRIAKTSNGYRVQYYYKDHLGSVRFVDGQYGRDDYMPYGSRMQADGYATSTSRTKFTGKELQTLSVTASNGALAQLGLYDFGARMYDPVTARWLTQDPLAEKYYSTSPYAYCGGNPVNRIDPNGMEWEDPEMAEALKNNIEQEKRNIQREIKRNERQLKNKNLTDEQKNTITAANEDIQARIPNLDQSITDINTISEAKEVFGFVLSQNDIGKVTYDQNSNKFSIHTIGDAMSIHEIRHAAQFLDPKNPTISLKNGELVSLDYKTAVSNEISAYKSQYSYSPTSIDTRITSIGHINQLFVKNMIKITNAIKR